MGVNTDSFGLFCGYKSIIALLSVLHRIMRLRIPYKIGGNYGKSKAFNAANIVAAILTWPRTIYLVIN